MFYDKILQQVILLFTIKICNGGFALKFLRAGVLLVLAAFIVPPLVGAFIANQRPLTTYPTDFSTTDGFLPATGDMTVYVPAPGSQTAARTDANAGTGIATHWGVFPPGTQIVLGGRLYVVDDKIGEGESEVETYARSLQELREGKRIHIDFRLLPGNGDIDKAVYNAKEFGRRSIKFFVKFPPGFHD